MKIKWLGHACYKIEADNYAIVVDPFIDGSVPGLNNIREEANLVLCSHEHGDHNFRDGVKIISNDSKPLKVSTINSYHDDVQGAKRGENIIHIIESDDVRVAHFGDLGCDLTFEQIQILGHLDAVLIPVGGYYTIDGPQAKAIVDKLDVNVVIPMHYCGDGFGFDVISDITPFASLCDNIVELKTNTVEITPNMPKATIIMDFNK